MINVVAEIGINFRGNILIAENLIHEAMAAGCWGVKFQFRSSDNFYNSKFEIGDELIANEINKNNLNISQIKRLQTLSHKLGLKFGLSFFRLSDMFFLFNQFDFNNLDFIKIPSSECLNKPLVDSAIRFSDKVMVSIGGHSFDNFLNIFSEEQYKKLIVLHCVSNYPVSLGSQNLARIDLIKKRYIPGYSSHDYDYEVCILALAKNIKWLERHLTIDKGGNSLDDSSSSNFFELKKICDFAKNYEKIFIEYEPNSNQGEILNMQNLGTSIYAVKDVCAGEQIHLADHQIKAPRLGLSVGEFLTDYINKPLFYKIKAGEALTEKHFTRDEHLIQSVHLEFCNKKFISLPVRLHDIENISKLISINNYEFHLSFSEALEIDVNKAILFIESDKSYSIHLPDYLPGNKIFDPISSNLDIQKISKLIIENVELFASAIQEKTGKSVPIIGSFSQTSGRCIREFFEILKSNFLEKRKFDYYPQWLPMKAWYFGGCFELGVFNNEESIDLIKELNFDICLDICHLILSANSAGINYRDWMHRLLPYTKHMHLADARGFDAEGLHFGSGEFGSYTEILSHSSAKVIEVWQGHHSNAYGFRKAILDLYRINNE
jgi:N-acetylneuraminate synthase